MKAVDLTSLEVIEESAMQGILGGLFCGLGCGGLICGLGCGFT